MLPKSHETDSSLRQTGTPAPNKSSTYNQNLNCYSVQSITVIQHSSQPIAINLFPIQTVNQSLYSTGVPQTIFSLQPNRNFPQHLTPNHSPPNNYISYNTPLPRPELIRQQQQQQPNIFPGNYHSVNTPYHLPAQHSQSYQKAYAPECPYYMTEIYNLLSQDETNIELIVNNFAMHEAPNLQLINLGSHSYSSLVKEVMFKFNLGTLKKFATKGINMQVKTFNKLLMSYIAQLKRGEVVDDFVDVIIKKWESLIYACHRDCVNSYTKQNQLAALLTVNFSVMIDSRYFHEFFFSEDAPLRYD